MRFGIVVGVAVVLGACRDSRTVTEVSPVSVPADAWSGGAVQVVSSGFATALQVRLVIAGDTLAATRLDSTTFEVTAPETSGVFAVHILVDGRSGTAGDVALHGPVSVVGAPSIRGNPLPWPYGTGRFVGSTQESQLVSITPSPGQVSTSPVLSDSMFDIGCGGVTSPGGNFLVVSAVVPGEGCLARVLNMQSETVLDSRYVFTVGRSPLESTAWMSEGNWVATYHSIGLFLQPPGGGDARVTEPHSAERLIATRDGRRMVAVRGTPYGSAPPILRAEAFLAPLHVDAPSLQAAAFSIGGDTLYAQRRLFSVGVRDDTLLVIDALTGITIRKVAADRTYSDLAVDPERPWLYAASMDSTGITLTIYDRRTMRVAAVQRRGGVFPVTIQPWDVHLAVNAAGRRLHGLTRGNSEQQWLLTWDLMP